MINARTADLFGTKKADETNTFCRLFDSVFEEEEEE